MYRITLPLLNVYLHARSLQTWLCTMLAIHWLWSLSLPTWLSLYIYCNPTLWSTLSPLAVLLSLMMLPQSLLIFSNRNFHHPINTNTQWPLDPHTPPVSSSHHHASSWSLATVCRYRYIILHTPMLVYIYSVAVVLVSLVQYLSQWWPSENQHTMMCPCQYIAYCALHYLHHCHCHSVTVPILYINILILD